MRNVNLPAVALLFALSACVLLAVFRAAIAQTQQGTWQKVHWGPWPSVKAANNARLRQLEPLHRQERTAMAQGNYAEAETACRKALSIDDQDAQSWLLLADVCERQNKQAEALRAYQALVYAKGWGSNINSDPTTYLRYALALTRSGRWQEAVAVYEKAMQSITRIGGKAAQEAASLPSVTDRTGLQTVAHYILGTRPPTFAPPDPAEQREHLAAAVRLRPRWAQAQFAYGQALAEAGQLAEAKAAFSRAAALAQGDLKPQVQKALESLKAREKGK